MEIRENILLSSKLKARSSKVRDVLVIAGILAALVIFFYKFVFFGMVPLNSDWLSANFYPWKAMGLSSHPQYFNNDTDPVLYMYPIKYITIQIMKHGALPLWDPYILCGAPLWGNNFACPLNPLNIVFFLFDFAKAWGIFLMLQFAVAGVSMYFLSLELGARRLGAGIAALAYMLNTAFVIWFQTMSYLGVFSWLPLVFLLIEKTVKQKSYATAFWCGISFALFVWSGQIQLAAYSAAFSAMYLLFRAFQGAASDRSNIRIYAALVLVTAAAAVLYSLPELIVQKTNIVNSTRTPGRYGLSLLYPQMLVSYLSPYFYGMKYDGWDLGFGTYIFNRGLIRLSPPYIGIFPLFLAAVGFITRKNRDKFFFLLSSAGILVMLMAFALPFVYKPVLKFIPFFGSVDHYRLTTIYAFSMAVMAGWGATALLRAGAGKRLCSRAVLTVFLSIVTVFLVLGVMSSVDARKIAPSLSSMEKSAPSALFDGSHSLRSVCKFFEYLNVLKRENGSLLLSREAVIPIAFASVSMLLALCLLRFGNRKLWSLFAFVFVAFDLLYYGLMFPAYSRPENVFPKTPSAEFLANDKSIYRVVGYSDRTRPPKGDAYPPNTGMLYGLYDVRGYENLAQAKWIYGFMMGGGSDEIIVERFNDYDNKVLDFLNVKYLLSGSAIRSDRWRLVYEKEIKIYENRNVVPRAFVTARGDDPDPLRGVVYYPVIRDRGANHMSIDLDGRSSGLLVVSETYFPGWKALVDGKEREVLKVYRAFRGVRVDAGDRNVKFVFRPRGLYGSLYICLGTMVIVIIFSLFSRFKRC